MPARHGSAAQAAGVEGAEDPHADFGRQERHKVGWSSSPLLVGREKRRFATSQRLLVSLGCLLHHSELSPSQVGTPE